MTQASRWKIVVLVGQSPQGTSAKVWLRDAEDETPLAAEIVADARDAEALGYHWAEIMGIPPDDVELMEAPSEDWSSRQ